MERRKFSFVPKSNTALPNKGFKPTILNRTESLDMSETEPSFKKDELRQPATDVTTAIISNRSSYPPNDSTDFDHAGKGNIEDSVDDYVIKSSGDPNVNVWNLEPYSELIDKYVTDTSTSYPDTVNPSLFRNLNLNMHRGVFEVMPGQVYQVRGCDISNMSFVKSTNGWIVLDPLRGEETAAKAFSMFKEFVDPDPAIKGVIYSHSHIDHFGGVGALLTADQVGHEHQGKIPIYAPSGFTDHAVSENVIAGNVMARRSLYQYGNLLTVDEKGAMSIGLGISVSTATTTFIKPSTEISTSRDIHIDGTKIYMQLTPGTEAPSEMNSFFYNGGYLWMAENTTNTFHNILTLRGAQVRDSLNWAKYIQQTIDLFATDATVKFQSHHWPLWEDEGGEILEYLKKQRDLYKYVHDQSVRLMNEGYIGSEISEIIRLPPSLDNEWALRGYYGSLRHNSRAVYQYYMGWYTSNPSDLNNLPPGESSKRYVSYMGGVGAIVDKVIEDWDNGDYRWYVEVLKHAIYGAPEDPRIDDAKEYLANAYEQLGYQAENGPWRNEYLTAAQETRAGVPSDLDSLQSFLSIEMVDNMRTTDIFDYMSISLNAEKAFSFGSDLCFKFTFTDPEKQEDEIYFLTLTNCTLNFTNNQDYGELVTKIDCNVECNQFTFNRLFTGFIPPDDFNQDHLDSGDYHFVVANQDEVHFITDLMGLFDTFSVAFDIVTKPGDTTPMKFKQSTDNALLRKLARAAPSMALPMNYKQSKRLTKRLNGQNLSLGPAAC